jgi:hypothetical protein
VGTCKPGAGRLEISVSACECKDPYIKHNYVSEGDETDLKSFSGAAKLVDPLIVPPACTITLQLIRPGGVKESLPSCHGASECPFSFSMLSGEYKKAFPSPRYVVFAKAVDCCIDPAKTEVRAVINIATITMDDPSPMPLPPPQSSSAVEAMPKAGPGGNAMIEGPYHCLAAAAPGAAENRNCTLRYFPECLVPTGAKVEGEPKHKPIYAKLKGPMSWSTTLSGQPAGEIKARLEEAWWYGWNNPSAPPAVEKHNNLCWHHDNPYALDISATFSQCGISVSNREKSVNIGQGLPEGFFTFREQGRFRKPSVNYVKKPKPGKPKSCCKVTYKLQDLKLLKLDWIIGVGAYGQFAEDICREEDYHRGQTCGNVGWANGGMNFNTLPYLHSLDGTQRSACVNKRLLETPQHAAQRACSAALGALDSSVMEKLQELFAGFILQMQMKRTKCWREKTAKEALGYLYNTTASAHLECAYADCPAVLPPGIPPEPPL